MFKNMTVGRQIGVGFGIVLLLLVIIGIESLNGIGNVVSDAENMITGESIIGEMKEAEIDHLNWLAHLSVFMTDPNVKTLKIETDHKECGFGKKLYGQTRKDAEQAVPALSPIFKQIEEPHRLLHESALEIEKHMNNLNIGEIITTFYRVEIAHRIWVYTALNEIINKKEYLSVQLDYRECGLGKWLYNGHADAFVAEFPGFAQFIQKIKAPHKIIHDTGYLINERLKAKDYDGAMLLIHEKVEPNVEEVCSILSECRMIVRNMEKGQKKAQEIFVSTTEVCLKKVQEQLHNITKTVENSMVTKEILLSGASRLKTVIFIVGVIVLLFGIGIAFFISKGLVRSLTKISNNMNDGAEQVASASGQVSSASQSLAEGASEQAASIEETSSSLEEMSSMTKQNADNAGQADTLMKEANQVVEFANQSMTELTKSMADISKASDETQKVVKTIDEIAFQTNLLALNAAVEAARAGEAGAGFAVVAEEVRNLALRSAEAAKSTAVLIEGTVKKVGEGSDLVNKTNEEFTRVAETASKVGSLVGEISAASIEQAQGIEQVNIAVSEMDKVIQQNAASAEESASASEELNAQAEQMKTIAEDLHTMIGGTGSKIRPTGASQSMHSNKTAKAIHSAVPVKERTNEPSRLIVHKNNEAKQIIPFGDDEDFKDF